MQPKFNINRPPVSDDEIEKHKNFDALVAQFKKQSLKKARGDESWLKNKKVQYTTVILGITVVCTITYQSIRNTKTNVTSKTKHETITTRKVSPTPSARKKPYVAPPLATLNKKTTAYRVNNQRGAELRHPSSTRIVVPKGAFVDNSGHEIIGEVTLEYREFEHLPDIIAAGIPMRHDSLGQPYQLESAGMFEINATQGRTPVKIREGSPITVDLASYNKDDRFLQYYLDTVSRNWRYLGTDKPYPVLQEPNKIRETETKDLAVLISKKQDSLDKKTETAIAALPKPRKPVAPVKNKPGRPTFVLEIDKKDFPELDAFENVVFEVGTENRHYTPELHEVIWSDVKITEGPVKGINYLLHLSFRNQKVQLVVYPVLKETDYRNAREIYESRLTAYNDAIKERQEKEERLRREAREKREMIAKQARELDEARSRQVQSAAVRHPNTANADVSGRVAARRFFQIANFGIYNSDHPHSMPPAQSVEPAFVDAQTRLGIQPETIYLIDHQRKTVINGEPGNFYLPASKKTDYSLCVVYGGAVYTCNKKNYHATLDAGSRTFELTRNEDASGNMADFRTALEL